jgi:cytochrome c oxidase cbb3-type subunit III
VSSRPEKDRILDHEYDGIREYDNPLPGWWVLVFYVSVAWAAGYALWWHAGPGVDARSARFAELDERLRAKAAASAGADFSAFEPEIRQVALSPDGLAAGASIFATRCLPCHGAAGEGIVGPNLTDDYVLHGWTLPEMYRVVSEGVPEKGMIAWKSLLSPAEMQQVTAYAASLRGTSPPNPKAPQGEPAGGRPLP